MIISPLLAVLLYYLLSLRAYLSFETISICTILVWTSCQQLPVYLSCKGATLSWRSEVLNPTSIGKTNAANYFFFIVSIMTFRFLLQVPLIHG